jgi:8-oxo-dGTP pyrophosphatase MutT (NUDIX family)
MLHLIPAPLHRTLYRLADSTRRLWWRVRKPQRTGVLVAAFDAAGRVLLVRHSYGPPVWTLPGGGIGRSEDPASAAAREFREELGCELVNVVHAAADEEEESGSRELRHLFAADLAGTPAPDMREIVAVGLFDCDALPVPCDRRVRPALARIAAAKSQQR